METEVSVEERNKVNGQGDVVNTCEDAYVICDRGLRDISSWGGEVDGGET